MQVSEGDMLTYLRRKALKIVGDADDLPKVTITREYDAIDWITSVSVMAKALVSKDETVFRTARGRYAGWAVVYNSGGVAALLVSAIRCAPEFVKKHYPYHRFDPRVEVFFRMLSHDPLVKSCVKSGMQGLSQENAEMICEHLNHFVTEYRAELCSERFRLLTKRCARNADKISREVNRSVAMQFVRCSRILVVRVDLYYPSEDSEVALTGVTVSADRLRRDRSRFLRTLKRCKFSIHLLGYCWKLEYGLKKGFHYHWLFFFDGASVREDITIGRLIGQTWEGIAGGAGLYWNCNAFKDKYTDLGIGMVSHSDEKKRLGLCKAVAYLTKPDYHLYLKEQDVGRTFGKSIIKARPHSARGRPRGSSAFTVADP